MNTRKGFTLVELLVVIAILAILATVSVVGYTAFIAGADEQAAITEAEQVKGTINAGLTLKDHVKFVCGTETVCVTRTEDGYEICASEATTDVHDATKDCVVPGTLAAGEEDGSLVYTVNNITVDLATLKVVPATEDDSE